MGQLEGQVAIVTGGSPGSAGRRPSASRRKAPYEDLTLQ